MRSITIWMMFLSYSLNAQTSRQGTIAVKKNGQVYTIVEQMPAFPGGERAMMTFIQTNLKYPQSAVEAGKRGIAYISLVINEDGSITDFVIEKEVGNCPECTQEALRIVRLMPNFIPGMDKGTAVKVRFFVPIRFILK
jgi:periplasmic protein TonB